MSRAKVLSDFPTNISSGTIGSSVTGGAGLTSVPGTDFVKLGSFSATGTRGQTSDPIIIGTNGDIQGAGTNGALDGTYDAYVIYGLNITSNTDDAHLRMQFYNGATPAWDQAFYDYVGIWMTVADGGFNWSRGTTTTYPQMFGSTAGLNTDETPKENGSIVIQLYQPSQSTGWPNMKWESVWNTTDVTKISHEWGGVTKKIVGAVTAVRLWLNTGYPITPSKFTVYGMKA